MYKYIIVVDVSAVSAASAVHNYLINILYNITLYLYFVR